MVDMDRLIPILIAVISSGSLTAIVTNAVNKNRANCIKNTALVEAVRLLLQDKIEYLGILAITEGKIAYARLKFINAAFACFKALGGDGDLDQLMDDLRNPDNVEVIYTRQSYATKGTK